MFKKSALLFLIMLFSLLLVTKFITDKKTPPTKAHGQEVPPTPMVIISNVTDTQTVARPQPIKLGIVVNGYDNRHGELSSIEKQLNKSLSTVSIFKQFGAPFNSVFDLQQLAFIKSSGINLLLAWEPWNPDQGQNQSIDYLIEIIEGRQDGYIRHFAQAVKDYKNPVTIRFAHEMNGNWYPWGNRADQYKSAYRHIVSIFREEGVQNVKWMWSINASNEPVSTLSTVSQFYPGNDVVDIIGLDGFNFGSSKDFGGWKSFDDLFQASYQYITYTYEKPLIISEVASSEMGGDKAEWIQNMFENLPLKYPKIQELVWFNLLKEVDWRITSSDSSLEAFRASLD